MSQLLCKRGGGLHIQKHKNPGFLLGLMVFSGEKIEQHIMAKVFADSSINEGYKNAEGQGYHGAQKGGAGDVVGKFFPDLMVE